MPNAVVHAKVAAAGVGGAAATVLVFILAQCGVHVGSEVGAAIASLIAFAAGYVKAA